MHLPTNSLRSSQSNLHEDAIKCLRPALKGLERLGHSLAIDAMASLAKSYFVMGRGGEGVQLLENAYEVRERHRASTVMNTVVSKSHCRFALHRPRRSLTAPSTTIRRSCANS